MGARLDKRRLATFASRRIVNPVVRPLVERGLPVPGTAVLETTGRRSGRPRRTPITDGLDGDVFWIVAEHGRRAAYVRNIDAEPRVRVFAGGRWRTGTARLLPDDDPRERLRHIGRVRRRSRLNTAMVRAMQTDLLTVRVELDA